MTHFSASKATGFLVAFVFLGATALQVQAQNISFQSGSYGAFAGEATQNQSASSFGVGAPASATDAPIGNAFSVTTADYEASGFSYNFSLGFANADSASGMATGVFVANAAGTYVITDDAPLLVGTGMMDDVFTEATFQDITTNMALYDTYGGGSLTGKLTAGDTYAYTAQADLSADTDPSLTYDASIAFAPSETSVTPEPSSLLLLGSGLLGVVGIVRRRAA